MRMIVRKIPIDCINIERLICRISISIMIDIIDIRIASSRLCEVHEARGRRDKAAGFIWVVGGLGADDYVGAGGFVGFCCCFEVVGEGVDGFRLAAGRMLVCMLMVRGSGTCLLVDVLTGLGATAWTV